MKTSREVDVVSLLALALTAAGTLTGLLVGAYALFTPRAEFERLDSKFEKHLESSETYRDKIKELSWEREHSTVSEDFVLLPSDRPRTRKSRKPAHTN